MKASNPFTLPVETECGIFEFECRAFQRRSIFKGRESYIVLKKEWGGAIPLVRMESACFFGQLLHSAKCNCGVQLDSALVRIGTEGGLAILALHQDGRGISIVRHANAYALQEKGLDTVESYLVDGGAGDPMPSGVG